MKDIAHCKLHNSQLCTVIAPSFRVFAAHLVSTIGFGVGMLGSLLEGSRLSKAAQLLKGMHSVPREPSSTNFSQFSFVILKTEDLLYWH